MAFIRNVDKLIEGLENKFFTEARAKAALAPELAAEETARLAGDSAEAAARESADNALDARLDVIEGSGEGSVAKAEQDAKDYADQKVAALVNSAPEVLDTLKELSDALGGDQNFAATVAGQIGAVDDKVDQEILDRQSAVSAEQSARELADQGLDGRLDVLEQDPTTKAYVDGEVLDLQGQITQEISDRQQAVSDEEDARELADSNLSSRISVLEQDPVTKTYVDGEVSDLQGQITQEISDRSAAITSVEQQLASDIASVEGQIEAEQLARESADNALDGRLDILEQDPVTKSYVDSEVLELDTLVNAYNTDLDARLDIIEGANTVEGSVAKAEKDAKDYADSLNSAMDSRVDVLEQDPTTKSYVDGEVLNLQGQVNTEKGRIDAILSASDADKDSFAEIVQLINSIDTSNDSSFAAYVLSNDAALAQEISDRQADVNAEELRAITAEGLLDGRLDVLEQDPTTKSYVDGIKSSLDAEDLLMFKKDGSRNMTGNILFQSNGVNNIGGFSSTLGILKNDYVNRPQHVIASGRVVGSRFNIQSFNNSTTAILDFGWARGTEASPTQSTHGGTAGQMQFWGMNELGAARNLANIRIGVANNTSSSSPSSASFEVYLPSLVNSTSPRPTILSASYITGIYAENSSGTQVAAFSVEADTPPSSIPVGYSTFGGGINCFTQLKVNAGLKVGYSAKSSDYTLVSSDYIVAVSDLSSSKVMTLPSAVTMGAGKTYVIKDQSGAASQSNYIQILPQSGQQIDGQSDYKVVMPYESVTLVSNGTHWFII